MTHVACKSKPRSFVRSSMHPSTGKCVAIGGAVVYYARAAHAFSVGIKYRHSTIIWTSNPYASIVQYASKLPFSLSIFLGYFVCFKSTAYKHTMQYNKRTLWLVIQNTSEREN